MTIAFNCLKAIWTVKAGVVIGHPITEHQRQWSLLSADWDGKTPEDRADVFEAKRDAAAEYARSLSDPSRVNWVTLEFVWI